MSETVWFFAVAGGPLLLAIIFAYVLIRRRKVSRAEFDAGERGARRIYEHRDPDTGAPVEGSDQRPVNRSSSG